MATPSVFVVVVTFNARSWLDKCLGTIRQSNLVPQTIVVDNCSTDGTWDVLQHEYPEVIRIRSEANVGFARGNNMGIRTAYEAGADYVFLLNQDAWITPTALDSLVDAHRRHPEFGILSPMHLTAEGDALDYNFRKFICRSVDSANFVSDLFVRGRKTLNTVYATRFINAALWLLPRRTLDIVGGFNPFFFMYGEDDEYCNRCHFHGLKIGYVPSAIAHHGRPQSDSGAKRDLLSRQRLAVDLLNPATKLTLGYHLSAFAVRSVALAITLNWDEAKRQLADFRYTLKYRKEITQSRIEVKQRGPTYLDPEFKEKAQRRNPDGVD